MLAFGSRSRRGFSILELCFALFITSIVLALTFVNLKPTIEHEGPRGFAYALASDIRAARAEAQKSGRLVAVCFPSDGKTNSVSHSVLIRKGDQRGQVWRANRYGAEFEANIFIGAWAATPEPILGDSVPDPWAVSVSDELAIFFRPDGTAFSNDVFPVAGRFPILVASGFTGTPTGANGRVTEVLNPNTVWVSSAGAVQVEENKAPVGTYPRGQTEYALAEMDLSSEPPSSVPQLVSAHFLPEKIDELSVAHVGQNFVSIHPEQKEGEFLEYGLATIELKVRDADGGPLHYVLTATATSGEGGEFTVPERKGPMRYVFDEGLNDYIWYGLISWRPPPGAPDDTEYELLATVTDPDGNTLDISTTAGLLPLVNNLPPSRLIMCSTDNQLFLTNLDGANEIHLTKDGQEHSPFFSADGSHVFSFHDLSATQKQLRRRTASGTHVYDPLCNFNGSSANIRFDPTRTFAAVNAPAGTLNFPWGRVDEESDGGGGEEDGGGGGTTYTYVAGANSIGVNQIFIINLMSNDTVTVSSQAQTSLQWNMLQRHAFYYTDAVESDWAASAAHAPGPYRVEPGYRDEDRHQRLAGYPSVPMTASGSIEPAYGKVFNPANRNWFLEVAGGNLFVRNRALGISRTLDSGSFQNDPDTHRTPKWSASGDMVAYIKNESGTNRLITKRVLESDLSDVLSSFPNNFDYTASGMQSAQLSPRGQWVYFLRGGSVFRASNSSSAPSPANISSHLGKTVKSYVLSP